MLSVSEMRRWCLSKTSRDQNVLRKTSLEFATGAFTRAIGIKPPDFYNWMHGKKELPRERLKTMSRLIEKYEAGMLEFEIDTYYAHNGRMRALKHRLTPRPMPTRMVIDFTGPAPRVQLLGRPKLEQMPDFPSLMGPLRLDAKGK